MIKAEQTKAEQMHYVARQAEIEKYAREKEQKEQELINRTKGLAKALRETAPRTTTDVLRTIEDYAREGAYQTRYAIHRDFSYEIGESVKRDLENLGFEVDLQLDKASTSSQAWIAVLQVSWKTIKD